MKHVETGKTARQIIDARLGNPLPPPKDLAPDQRTGILNLGLLLSKEKDRD